MSYYRLVSVIWSIVMHKRSKITFIVISGNCGVHILHRFHSGRRNLKECCILACFKYHAYFRLWTLYVCLMKNKCFNPLDIILFLGMWSRNGPRTYKLKPFLKQLWFSTSNTVYMYLHFLCQFTRLWCVFMNFRQMVNIPHLMTICNYEHVKFFGLMQ